MLHRIIFVQHAVWEKIYCMTIYGGNCVRVKMSCNECAPQLADNTEFVRVGSA